MTAMDDFVTGSDIGRRLGVSRERVSRATGHAYGFPEAVMRIGTSKIWRWDEVSAWYDEYRKRRKPGRPRGRGGDQEGRA